ncbi:MAG: diguanylate cyclase (GGDEF)-like protein [Motiliproteus sp.]|jgi:diguanylate cyclase (GGDEF)-like protein
MKNKTLQNLNNFCSGHLVVNKNREIVFCNTYICNLSEQSNDNIVNGLITSCFSKASRIFIDSYIYPILIKEKIIQESQMHWCGKEGKKIPVVVNIRLEEQGTSFWSIYVCSNRDLLYDELIIAKEKLEQQSRDLYLLATTDSLTGLLNRREMLVQVKRLTSQVVRNSSTFALLSIDIDLFKKVNDTYGHPAGDKVLTHLANILTKDRRAQDIIARMGGEEFILVLPDMDEANAFIFAENIRESIENQPVDNINITVSIGLVVSHKYSNVDFDFLLRLSDNALYDAKNSGRNRTVAAKY